MLVPVEIVGRWEAGAPFLDFVVEPDRHVLLLDMVRRMLRMLRRWGGFLRRCGDLCGSIGGQLERGRGEGDHPGGFGARPAPGERRPELFRSCGA